MMYSAAKLVQMDKTQLDAPNSKMSDLHTQMMQVTKNIAIISTPTNWYTKTAFFLKKKKACHMIFTHAL